MSVRVFCCVVVLLCAGAVPADAQSSASPFEVGAGVAAVWRDGTSGPSPGGAVTLAFRGLRSDVVVEAGGTRRDGHNDWRILGGPRFWLIQAGGSGLYAHGMAGVLIRTNQTGAVLQGGVGAQWQGSG